MERVELTWSIIGVQYIGVYGSPRECSLEPWSATEVHWRVLGVHFGVRGVTLEYVTIEVECIGVPTVEGEYTRVYWSTVEGEYTGLFGV